MPELRYKAMPVMCHSCIMRQYEHALHLNPGRLNEIMAYTLRGQTHLCHNNPHCACRGMRDYQLKLWHRMGIIESPTDEALQKKFNELFPDA
jgi:hypothetical protein